MDEFRNANVVVNATRTWKNKFNNKLKKWSKGCREYFAEVYPAYLMLPILLLILYGVFIYPIYFSLKAWSFLTSPAYEKFEKLEEDYTFPPYSEALKSASSNPILSETKYLSQEEYEQLLNEKKLSYNEQVSKLKSQLSPSEKKGYELAEKSVNSTAWCLCYVWGWFMVILLAAVAVSVFAA